MKLTGKAKEVFEKWYFETQCSSNMKFEELLPHDLHDVFGWLYQSNKTIQNALIIEFFDSVGICIGIQYFEIYSIGMYDWRIHYYNFYGTNNSRQEATIQAIKKANEIYNAKTS